MPYPPGVAAPLVPTTTPLPLDFQRDHQIGRRQRPGPALGPFDQPQHGTALVQTEEIELAGLADAVQVQVPCLAATGQRVAFDQGVGRAADGALHAQCAQQCAGGGGFAGAEGAAQLDQRLRRPGRRQPLPEQFGGIAVGKEEFGHGERSGLASRRSGASRSVGSRPRAPSAAAESPASACSKAPAAAASNAARPCARRLAMMPVSRSPIPPTAMPGLPAAISRGVCAGAATMLPAPFSTTTAWKRSANACALA
ncbi:hypothetical protein G6F68_012593 [Rhizopus microsporus]|nr:hypothetical protein G6F68_012593 [Rhizopus microsporus]